MLFAKPLALVFFSQAFSPRSRHHKWRTWHLRPPASSEVPGQEPVHLKAYTRCLTEELRHRASGQIKKKLFHPYRLLTVPQAGTVTLSGGVAPSVPVSGHLEHFAGAGARDELAGRPYGADGVEYSAGWMRFEESKLLTGRGSKINYTYVYTHVRTLLVFVLSMPVFFPASRYRTVSSFRC